MAYLLGGSEDGRAASMACGLSARGAFPVMRRELRAWPGAAAASGRSLARAMRRAMRRITSRPRRSSVGVSLRQVAAFDGESKWVMDRVEGSMAFIERSAALLNYALRYPAATTFGYTLHVGERLCGIALLRIIPQDDQRLGRIVDCLVSDRDVDLWHGSLLALSEALREHGADTATFYASLPWSAEAAARAGFRSERLQPVFIREAPFPAALPLYVSQLEADHGLY